MQWCLQAFAQAVPSPWGILPLPLRPHSPSLAPVLRLTFQEGRPTLRFWRYYPHLKATRTLTQSWWECKTVQPLWKAAGQFFIKMDTLLPCNPAVPLLGTYLRELPMCIHTKPCARMFITALFINARTWKQPQCPSADEWISKLWCIGQLNIIKH